MTQRTTLITGAGGEIGHALVQELSQDDDIEIVTLDLHDLPDDIQDKTTHYTGDITDTPFMKTLASDHTFDTIYHLAAILSTTAERKPELAHKVNVNGTQSLFEMATKHTQTLRKPVRFLFPSSAAIYGMPTLEIKAQYAKVKEEEWTLPTTMYGVNKLYCENLGIYYSDHYKRLAEEPQIGIDFRSLRFPGLISAFTIPSGGTSDYGPEMLHAAAQGKPYECFVRPDTTMPFMAMPDAIAALLKLAEAPIEKLTRRVYNVTAFSLSAEEFHQTVKQSFPDAEMSYNPHPQRQGIVDTWPIDLDDSAARQDWGWQPEYNLKPCFEEYLVPNIKARYQEAESLS